MGVDLENELTVVDIVKGTLALANERKKAVLLYVGTVALAGTIFEWSLPNVGGVVSKITQSVAGIVGLGLGVGLGFWLFMWMAQYLLWEAMLQRPIQLADVRANRFLAFLGQQILMLLGCVLGLVLLIIPGLVVLALWSTAPAFLIEERTGVVDSMRNSWNQMSGNATPVVLILIAFGLAYLVVGGFAGAMQSESGTGVAALPLIFVTHLLWNLQAALTIALGVFLFNRLPGRTKTLSSVFE